MTLESEHHQGDDTSVAVHAFEKAPAPSVGLVMGTKSELSDYLAGGMLPDGVFSLRAMPMALREFERPTGAKLFSKGKGDGDGKALAEGCASLSEIDELKRYDLRQGDWAGVTQQSSSLGTQHCAVPGAPPVAGAEVSGFQFAFQQAAARLGSASPSQHQVDMMLTDRPAVLDCHELAPFSQQLRVQYKQLAPVSEAPLMTLTLMLVVSKDPNAATKSETVLNDETAAAPDADGIGESGAEDLSGGGTDAAKDSEAQRPQPQPQPQQSVAGDAQHAAGGDLWSDLKASEMDRAQLPRQQQRPRSSQQRQQQQSPPMGGDSWDDMMERKARSIDDKLAAGGDAWRDLQSQAHATIARSGPMDESGGVELLQTAERTEATPDLTSSQTPFEPFQKAPLEAPDLRTVAHAYEAHGGAQHLNVRSAGYWGAFGWDGNVIVDGQQGKRKVPLTFYQLAKSTSATSTLNLQPHEEAYKLSFCFPVQTYDDAVQLHFQSSAHHMHWDASRVCTSLECDDGSIEQCDPWPPSPPPLLIDLEDFVGRKEGLPQLPSFKGDTHEKTGMLLGLNDHLTKLSVKDNVDQITREHAGGLDFATSKMRIKATDTRSNSELKTARAQGVLQPMPDELQGQYHPLQGPAGEHCEGCKEHATSPPPPKATSASVHDDLARTLDAAVGSWNTSQSSDSTLLETVESTAQAP